MGQPTTGFSEFQTPPVPIGLHSFQTPNPVRPAGEGRLANCEAPVNFGLPVAPPRPKGGTSRKSRFMSKEIYISSTPHETRLAIVEEEALSEIYYERENEYTLAGSIYNGRVTRVLPGMQSAFVDIGLDRDAFLYITDFLEEAADPEEFDTSAPRPSAEGERGGRGRRGGRPPAAKRQLRNCIASRARYPPQQCCKIGS